jgi:hypothetical protein
MKDILGRNHPLVRREKDLMIKFTQAHKEGDRKTLTGVQREIQRTLQQRRDAR